MTSSETPSSSADDVPSIVPEGFAIAGKFRDRDFTGPVTVRRFAAEQGILDGRDEEEWQTDGYGQVSSFLKAIGMR